MPTQKFKLATVLTAVFLITLSGGCTKPVAKTDTDSSETELASKGDSKTTPEVNIATQPNTLPEKDASAKQVCERFLELLAQGERSLAEQLLTPRALKTTVAAGLELEAMGDSESTLEVGDAMYATTRAKVAQVPCTSTSKDGTSQSIQWLMRRGDSGWRIAGLIVDSGSTQELLSLESVADVASIVGSETGGSGMEQSDSGSIRLVSGTDED